MGHRHQKDVHDQWDVLSRVDQGSVLKTVDAMIENLQTLPSTSTSSSARCIFIHRLDDVSAQLQRICLAGACLGDVEGISLVSVIAIQVSRGIPLENVGCDDIVDRLAIIGDGSSNAGVAVRQQIFEECRWDFDYI